MATIAAEAPIENSPREPILTPATLALSGLMVASMSSFYLLLSAVPAHVAALGGDLAAGFATSALMATTIIGELAAPRMIARFGRRAAMAIALLVLAIPCLFTFSGSLNLVLWSCAARGFGLGILLVAACGLAATLAPPARRAEAMGLYGVASAIPAIVCVPLGPWALMAFGPAATALAAAALALAGLAGLAVLPRRAEQHEGTAPSHRLPALRGAAWPAAGLGLGAIVIGATITFLPLAPREVNTGTIMLGMLIQGLASAGARWAAGRPVDRHGPQGVMFAGIALAVGAMLCLALPGEAAVLIGMAVSGIAFGVLQSASLAQLLQRATPAQADGASALWNAAYDAGLGIGGLAFGALASATGYAAAFLALGAGLAGLALLVFRSCEASPASC
jgi:predicted MFS family arabinose efflux permease